MGEVDRRESLQAAVSNELADAMAIDEAVNEEFDVYWEENCWEIKGYHGLTLTACECLLLPNK